MRNRNALRLLSALALATNLSCPCALAAEEADTESDIAALRAELRAAPGESALRLRLANALLSRKRLHEALEVLPETVAGPELVLLRAKLLLWSSNFDAAAAQLVGAPRAIRELLDARVCYADILLAQGKWLEAKHAADGALAMVPTHPDARALKRRAVSELLKSSDLAALTAITYQTELRAIEDSPEAARAEEEALHGAIARLPEKERAAAIDAIERAWPDQDARHAFLLDAELRSNLHVRAFRRIEQRLAKHPQDTSARKLAGDVACGAAWSALGAKDPQTARTVGHSKFVPEKPNCLLIATAQAELILGRFEPAAALYAVLRKRDPNNLDIRFGATETALSGNHLPLADKLLQSLERNPKADPARVRNLRLNFDLRSANGALQQGKYQEAERFARHALTQSGTSPDAFMLLSAALQCQKREADAMAVLREGEAANPKVPRLFAAMARLPGPHDHAALAKRALSFPLPPDRAERLDLELALGDALVQDRRFAEAKATFRRLRDRDPDNQTIRLRLASVSMREQDPFSAVDQLHDAYLLGPSFDATLALADAYHGLNLERSAIHWGETALVLKPGQPDAVNFMDRLQFAHAPTSELRVLHTWDNGTNQAWEYGARAGVDLNPDLRLSADAGRRDARTVVSGEKSTLYSARLKLKQNVSRRVALSGGLGLASVVAADDNALLPLGHVRTDVRVGTEHRLSFGYEADTFAYTAGMIKDHLGLHVASATGNGPILGHLSFYTAASAAYLTDQNWRGVVFSSLYYQFFSQPTVKAGVNGQVLGFSSTAIRSYFSPGQLLNGELFAEILRDDVDARFLYGGLAAMGLQRIEQMTSQGTYRFSALLGVRPLRALKLIATGQLTNSQSTTVSGFRYYELGAAAELTFH